MRSSVCADATDADLWLAGMADRLADRSLTLPPVPRPLPSFVPWRCSDDLVFISGQTCLGQGGIPFQGPVEDLPFPSAQIDEALELAAMNLLSALSDFVKTTGRVPRTWVQVLVFLQGEGDPGLASGRRFMELLTSIDAIPAAMPAPTVVCVTQLPLNSSVTVDALLTF
jgi:enamine deaminase RidA (YjgF/YER057c/UK114 family)